jgi:hypothetical protein
VAGVFGAKYNDGKAGLYDGRLFDAENVSLDEALFDRNPDIASLSYAIGGSLSEVEELDTAVYRDRIFIANGSGNEPSQVVSCDSYNSLCVGNYRHEGTVNDFSDDRPGGSSYLNDSSGREEPKIVGPGRVDGVATAVSTYTNATGTSFATPYVASTAGLLMRAFPNQLRREPTLVRAVLMASAVRHRIAYDNDGSPIPNLRFNDAVDDKTGVGVPHGPLAVTIVDDRQYKADTHFTPFETGVVATVDVPASGMNFRAVLTWDNCPNPTNALVVDLDLALEGERLTAPITNRSTVDNYEVIDAVLPRGTYQLRVTAPRWGNCSLDSTTRRVPMALAWATTQVWIPDVHIEARQNTGKCIHKKNPGFSNGNPVHLWTCTSGVPESKDWYYESSTGRIRSAANPYVCFHKKEGGWANGNPIHLWDCAAGSEEMKAWTYSPDTGQIHSRENPTKCIQKKNNDWTNGNPLQLWDCSANSASFKSFNLNAEQPGNGTL